MKSYIKWAECKIIDPAETMKMLRDSNKQYLVPGVEEEKNPTSET